MKSADHANSKELAKHFSTHTAMQNPSSGQSGDAFVTHADTESDFAANGTATLPPPAHRSQEAAVPPSAPPPRGASGKSLVLFAALVVAVFVLGTLWGPAMLSGARRLWNDLLGGEEEVASDDGQPGDTPDQFWTCGMHPWVILPEPGLCPICHMDLTPLDPSKLTGEIAIDPVVVQNIGVRVAPVTTGPLTREIRTVGTVTYDEAAVRDVNTKIGGWIEKLYVDETGIEVVQGEPLFELYSPDLYQAQAEYLQAIRTRSSLGKDLADAARRKLQYLDITAEQIRELERRGAAKKTLKVTSPHHGVVIEKNAHEGMKIEPGTLVYRIADLSTVWVMATFYEYQLPYLKTGQTVQMTLTYEPGKEFSGKVAYIYPYLKDESRQVKVRLEFENPNRTLKPGMFANVELNSTLDEQAVLAPREAVISTGNRQVAFVSLGEGKFEPREVETGAETGLGQIQILEGLKPGEKVVTSAQFLLDSESKMRAALAKMVKGQSAAEQTAELQVAEVSVVAELPEATETALNEVLRGYSEIGDQLVKNTTMKVRPLALPLKEKLAQLTAPEFPDKPDYWQESAEIRAMRKAIAELGQPQELDQARRSYARLSGALVGLLEETGVPLSFGERVEALTCPMYPPTEGGAVWLQPAGQARNPYMGEGPMLRCVGERQMLPTAGEGKRNSLSTDLQAQVDRAVANYLKLQQALYQNRAEGSPEQVDGIRRAALEVAEARDDKLRSTAERLVQTATRQPADLAPLRAAFKGLSAALIELVEQAPQTSKAALTLQEVYCPMAKASWLQSSSEIQNPLHRIDHHLVTAQAIRYEPFASKQRRRRRATSARLGSSPHELVHRVSSVMLTYPSNYRRLGCKSGVTSPRIHRRRAAQRQ